MEPGLVERPVPDGIEEAGDTDRRGSGVRVGDRAVEPEAPQEGEIRVDGEAIDEWDAIGLDTNS